MKQFLGLLLIILAIPMAFYVGGWLCLIGGIVQFIEGAKATPVNALDIAIGTARFLGASIAGIFAFWVMLLPGLGLLFSKIRF